MNCKERFTSKSNKGFRCAIKNSPRCTTLELFIGELYNKITDINTTCIFNQIEILKHLA